MSAIPVTPALVYLGLILVVGYAVVCLVLRPPRHWLEIAGLSFAAGLAVIPAVLFLFSLVGFRPSKTILGLIALATIVALVGLVLRQRLLRLSLPAKAVKDKFSLLGGIGLVVIVLAAGNVDARSSWPGMNDFDAFGIWMFKAKVLAIQPLHRLPAMFRDPGLSYSHQDYPLSFPLLISGLYAAAGAVVEPLAKSLLLPTFLAVVAVMYAGLRSLHRRAVALALTALFAATPTLLLNASVSVAETPLLLFFTATWVMLLRWTQRGRRADLISAACFAAAAAFTKNEGLAMLPVVGAGSLVLAVTRPHRRRVVVDWSIAAAISFALVLPWLIFRRGLPHTHEDYGGKLTDPAVIAAGFSHLRPVLTGLAGWMFYGPTAGPVWFVLVVAAVVGYRSFTFGPVLLFWFVLVAQLGLYVGTFLVTPWKLEQLIPMIAPKLLVQVSPVAVVLIGLHLRGLVANEVAIPVGTAHA